MSSGSGPRLRQSLERDRPGVRSDDHHSRDPR